MAKHSNTLAAVWKFRGLARAIAERDLRARYTGSVLGPLWLVLQPLAMVLVYTVIFSQVMQARLPGADSVFAYSQYLCSGLIAWNLYTEITQRCKNLFVEHANLIKKVSFPRLVLLVPVLVVAIFNFVVMSLLFFIFLALIGQFPGWSVFSAIPNVLVLIMLALAGGLLAGTLHVFWRDVGQTMDIVLQLLFWGTPIVYPLSVLPDWARSIVELNPMAGPIINLQHLFTTGEAPSLLPLAYPLAIAVLLALAAYGCYQRLYADMLDQL